MSRQGTQCGFIGTVHFFIVSCDIECHLRIHASKSSQRVSEHPQDLITDRPNL